MRLLALPVFALVVLGSGAAADQTGVGNEAEQAAKTTLATSSARFVVSFDSEREAGVIDLGNETAVLDRGFIFGARASYRSLPRREAAVLGISEKRWDESAGGGYSLIDDPFLTGTRSVFDVIAQAEQVRALGSGTERGVPVRRYSAKVPLEAFLAELGPWEEEETSKPGESNPTSWREYLVDYLGAEEDGQSVEFAVDQQNRIRRVRLELFGPVTVELYDYGVRVDANSPPANEVISSTAYEKLKSDYCSDPRRQTLPRPYPCT